MNKRNLLPVFPLLTLFFVLIISGVQAQVLRVFPYFPTVNDNVTIVYDATQGNGALALAGDTVVYAHTGLITTASVSDTDWVNSIDTWGTVDPKCLMTYLGNNKFSITFNIKTFYGVTATDTVLKLAFVFRNASGSVAGRNSDGSNIILPLIQVDSLQCAFVNPHVQVLPINSTVNLLGVANVNCDTLRITENGNILGQQIGNDSVAAVFHLSNNGAYNFVLQANDSSKIEVDKLTILVNPPNNVQDPPDSVIDGINYLNDSTVVLLLTAPLKSFVYVIGDFTNWQTDTAYLMNQSVDGTKYWLQVNNLTPGKEYMFQYLVDGYIRIGDPYCDKIIDPSVDFTITPRVYPNLIPYPAGKTTGIVSVLQTAQTPYPWKVTNFVKPDKKAMVVYELLVRDFSINEDYVTVIDSLKYLKRLGVNTIELMPIMNFESNSSWGYNPNYYFAAEKVYGPKDSLKKLIDTCHSLGIAVLLDIAMNDAFGSNPWVMMYWDSVQKRPAPNSPWLNVVAPHPYSVGYDFNHESQYTKDFVTRVTRYWVQQYHADGYRFDLTKGYTQYNSNAQSNPVGVWGELDTSRVTILENMVDSIWAIDSTTICVFEELADNDEQVLLANHGILLWGNENCTYSQATMGYDGTGAGSPCTWNTSAISWEDANYNSGWTQPNLVGYMESHDEQRVMYNNETYGDSVTAYDIKNVATGCARMEAAGAVFFPVPGPKMIYEFGELGYDVSQDANNCNVCAKPVRWSYETVPYRQHLFQIWSQMIKLKETYPVFTSTNYSIEFGSAVKWLKLNAQTDTDFNVLTIANFDVKLDTFKTPFQHTGKWYDFLNADSFTVTSLSEGFGYQAGEYHIYTDKYIPLFVDSSATVDTTHTGIISPATANQLMMFPNPTDGPVNIMLNVSKKSEVDFGIFDLSGKQIYSSQQTMLPGVQFLTANISNNPGGIYFYRVSINGELFNGKIAFINR